MDNAFKDGELVALFLELVELAHLQTQVDNGEVVEPSEDPPEGRMHECFVEMARIYELYPRFQQQRYMDELTRRLRKIPQDDPSIWPIFSHHCRFLTAIAAIEDLPELIGRFRTYGWLEWTHLQLVTGPFEEYAMTVICGAERMLEEEGNISFEAAHMVNHISLAFDMELPTVLGEYIKFVLCDTPNEYQEERWDQPGGSSGFLQ